MSDTSTIVNIAAYKFIALDDVAEIQVKLRRVCLQQGLLGTILLGSEGINLMLAGKEPAIEHFMTFLHADARFSDVIFKPSFSESVPFSRLVVKVKNEIIRMDKPEIHPEVETATHLAPETLKAWIEEQKDIVILDTRNDYEVEVGTFKNAVHLNIEDFRTFPAACEKLPEEYKTKPVITFCTGGIRCEKASAYLMQQGYQEVYQLDGGVLNYFMKCDGAYWEGECFVFDNRVSLTTQLQESNNFKHLIARSTH